MCLHDIESEMYSTKWIVFISSYLNGIVYKNIKDFCGSLPSLMSNNYHKRFTLTYKGKFCLKIP